jgi:hypothetical protein
LIALCFFVTLVLNVRSQTTQRNGLAEEFSASSCFPCKLLNDQYYPATVSIGVNDTANHVNAISYQMNYPGNGDLSYNLHSQQRYNYYTITGLPALKVNGKGIPANQTYTAYYYTALDTSRNAPARFKIDGTYEINSQASVLNVTVNIRPLTTLAGKYRVHIAVVERHYYNYADTDYVDMPEYHYVMRRMFPDGNGKAENSWTANVVKTYTYTAPYQVNNPVTQGSFDFWGNPFLSDVIAFVQDSSSRRIMQSKVIKPIPSIATSIEEAGNSVQHVVCYPNPVEDYLHVSFILEQKQEVRLQLSDLSGRVVYSTAQAMDAGAHQFNLPMRQFSPGLYMVQLSSGSDAAAKQYLISAR